MPEYPAATILSSGAVVPLPSGTPTAGQLPAVASVANGLPTGWAWATAGVLPSWNAVSKSAAYTAVAGDLVEADISASSWTLGFPASPVAGQQVAVKIVNVAGANVLSFGSNVDGAAFTMSLLNHTVVFSYDGTGWKAIASSYPKTTWAPASILAKVSSVDLLPRRPARGLARQQLQGTYRASLDALLKGTLVTKKAVQTGKEIRFAAPGASASPKIPLWGAISSGLGGDNAAFIADKGWISAVTAVYDLTTDPGKATNLLGSFSVETQQLVSLTATPALNDTLAVECSYVPYQGVLSAYAPQDAQALSSLLLECVYSPRTMILTVSGTGGGGSAAAQSNTTLPPVAVKVPLGSGVTAAAFFGADTIAWHGETPDASAAGIEPPWFHEGVPIVHDGSINGFARIDEGTTFSPSTTLGSQGAQYVTTPTQVRMVGPKLTTPGTNNSVLTITGGLARLVNLPESDDNFFELGRLFLYVLTQRCTTSDMYSGGSNVTGSAVDLFIPTVPSAPAPLALPSYYEGLVGIQ